MAALTVAVILILQVALVRPHQVPQEWDSSILPQSLLDSVMSRTSQTLQSLWRRGAEARSEDPAGGGSRSVSDDWYSCAQQTKEQYVALLDDVRRSAGRCWGWEPHEVEALGRAFEDLLFAGDRLPTLLKQRMDTCLHHPPTISKVSMAPLSRARRATEVGAGPSPFRVMRCSVQCAGMAWSYVSAVPREALHVVRRSAALLGSSREDWLSCSQRVLGQSAGPVMQLVRDLGICVADHLAQHFWEQERHKLPKTSTAPPTRSNHGVRTSTSKVRSS